MTSYRNNLQNGDRVIHAETKRIGTVEANPRESSVTAKVHWQGTMTAQAVHISKLRLVVGGQPESVPPCDGVPAEHGPRAQLSPRLPAPPPLVYDPSKILREKREANEQEQFELNKRFRALKEENERIDVALNALNPS